MRVVSAQRWNSAVNKALERLRLINSALCSADLSMRRLTLRGTNLQVLRGLHQPIPYVSFEVNLPEFRQEGLECIERVNEIDANTRFNYTTECKRGLALEEWVDRSDFVAVFSQITDPSVEVFSATPLPAGHKALRGE